MMYEAKPSVMNTVPGSPVLSYSFKLRESSVKQVYKTTSDLRGLHLDRQPRIRPIHLA